MLTADVNKNKQKLGKNAESRRKNIFRRLGMLLNVFLREIIHNAYAHFLSIRCGKELDAAAVKHGTQPRLRIQTQTFGFCAFHRFTPRERMPTIAALYNGN